jgi:hypothetical protein
MSKPVANLLETMTHAGVLSMNIESNVTSLRLKGTACSVRLEMPESTDKFQEMVDLCDGKLSELHYLRVAGGGKLFIRRK